MVLAYSTSIPDISSWMTNANPLTPLLRLNSYWT